MSQIKVDTITDEAGTGAPNFPNGIEVGGQTLLMPNSSPLVTLSGSNVDFTDIPATARRVTVMISNLSTNGTTVPLIQLGDSGGIEATGYEGATSVLVGTTNSALHTTGAGISSTWAATIRAVGLITITLMDAGTNTWSISATLGRLDVAGNFVMGYTKSLSNVLTQIRITAGANSFDSGTASVSWE